jgi:hypothetical protein
LKVTDFHNEFIDKFRKADKSSFVEFEACTKPLDMALWVLCVAKEKLNEKKITSEQIAAVIVDVQEISISDSSITNALKRALDKVHTYHENSHIYYEIMRPGKEYLLSLQTNDLIRTFYFESETRYSSKSLLKNQIFDVLVGEVKILDPYCSERTLDLLTPLKDHSTKLLTRLSNLNERDKQKFVRELKDFKTENPNIEFRDYPNPDIHDRYIITNDRIILVGHSLKDLGSKESFAVILEQKHYHDIYENLIASFNRRWKISPII